MRRLLILVVLAIAIPAEAARADTGSIAINSAVGDVEVPAGVSDRAAGGYARTAWARRTALKAR